MNPPCIGPFTYLSANYNPNNYGLNLSMDPSANLIYNNFHISKCKPYMNNNSTLFPQYKLAKPGPLSQARYEVKKVIAYCKSLRTRLEQYKVRCFGY